MIPTAHPVLPPATTATPAAPEPARPWWRHGYLLLVLAGPVAVVLASIVTFGLIVQGSDAVVPRTDGPAASVREQLARERALMPAHQARNHAATPTTPR